MNSLRTRFRSCKKEWFQISRHEINRKVKWLSTHSNVLKDKLFMNNCHIVFSHYFPSFFLAFYKNLLFLQSWVFSPIKRLGGGFCLLLSGLISANKSAHPTFNCGVEIMRQLTKASKTVWYSDFLASLNSSTISLKRYLSDRKLL